MPNEKQKMKEFTCIVCGAKGIDTSHSQNKMFCSLECKNYHWRRTHGQGESEYERCVYNDGVMCDDPNCKRCGWNPDVTKRRMGAIYG